MAYAYMPPCEGCGKTNGKQVKRLCPECREEHRLIRRNNNKRKYKGADGSPPRLITKLGWQSVSGQCSECGAGFEYKRIPGTGVKKYCSARCRKRKGDRLRTSARRALTRGASVDAVDPIVVFERDGWRCGICGTRTLKSKRGTTHNRAPELDHIVALSLGGAHSYANTQCACRKCNNTKGAGSLGQLHLFPMGCLGVPKSLG